MTDDGRWLRIQELFEVAVTLEAEARHRYVRRECAGDAALEAEVECLIEAERRSRADHAIARAIVRAARGLA